MSILTTHSMTNHHAPSVFAQLAVTFHVWHARYRARRELFRWTSRELQDIGLSWGDVAHEVEKPFWRA